MTKEREIPWNKLHPWMKASYDFAVVRDSWFAVQKDSEEHKSWAKYFAQMGWVGPWAFRDLARAMLDGEKREWTAPCRWPEWLTIDIDKTLAQLEAAE